MASKSRRSDASVIDALSASPEEFEFIQAVRVVERARVLAAPDSRFSDTGVIGSDTDPRRETLRLRAAPGLAFPVNEIFGFDDSTARAELTVTLMGLMGVSGVLPSHYTRLVLEAERDNNPVPRDFLDMFNHRALSLFVRAADKYRLPLAYERMQPNGSDAITAALLSLVGMRGPALRNRQALPDESLIFFGGHFSRGVRTADALRRMLSTYFDQPVGVLQFQGSWADLPPESQSRLGGATVDPARYASLGANAVVGTRVWDVQGSFRIELGPLDYARFQRFMPGAPDMAQLVALTRSYVGAALNFDVQLTLEGAEVPAVILSSSTDGARLGWNTWLPTTGARGDARDAVFQAEKVA